LKKRTHFAFETRLKNTLWFRLELDVQINSLLPYAKEQFGRASGEIDMTRLRAFDANPSIKAWTLAEVTFRRMVKRWRNYSELL
jgi:hypothetical protein